MSSEAAGQFKEGAGPLALWAGVLAGPLATLTQLQVNYALVLWACGAGGREWPLHLVSLLALLVSIGAGLLSWRNWRLAGEWGEDDAGVLPRSRFMAAVGMLISLHAALVVVAQWAAVFAYGPCER